MSLANQPAYTITKDMQTKRQRVKPTQRQMGAISPSVRSEVKARSMGVCEVQTQCRGSQALEMAHIVGRKQLTHKTTAEDLRHSCVACHRWLDGTPEGIRYKRALRQ